MMGTLNLTPDQLAHASAETLDHYQRSAESFWEGTATHDVSQNYTAFLSHLVGSAPFSLLDLGCGPGRDLRHFASLGHDVVGLDGCERFCQMARAHAGCQVLHQDFLHLSLEPARYHGVFANASLFHVPSQELPRVLAELHASLKPAGVLFSSNPRGHNQEGFANGRYGCFWDLATWRTHLEAAGFAELEHYYRPPGKPRDQQPWLATVWRRR